MNQYYSNSELLRILQTDPEQLIEIIKQLQKEDAERNGKELYFNDDEIIQDDEIIENDEEYL